MNIDEVIAHWDSVLERVEAGVTITIERDGRPVALLVPVHAPEPDAATLLERWRQLPHVDPGAVRRDIDAHIDPSP